MAGFSESLLTTTVWIITDILSKQFYTLSRIRPPLFLPNTFAIHFSSCFVCISIRSAQCKAAKKAENISLWKESRILSLYTVRYSDNCCKFGISGTFTAPSPLSLGTASLPLSAPVSPSISSLAARQELQGPSKAKPLPSPALGEWHRSSFSNSKPGVFAKRPTAKSTWSSIKAHVVCNIYSCLVPRGLEETWLGSSSAAKVQPACRPDSSSVVVNRD